MRGASTLCSLRPDSRHSAHSSLGPACLPACLFLCVCVSQGNFTFTAELIVALIAFITAVWLSLYMGWAIHSLRLIPRFTNTLLGCCGKQYEVGGGGGSGDN